MPKKSSPVFQKVSNLLNISIFLAKMKKPIIPRLISLKKVKKMKKFSLIKHYNYGYVQEYEFSPSNTPLLQYYNNRKKSLTKQRSYKDFCSVLFISKCLGMANDGEEKRKYPVLASMEDVKQFSDFGEEDNDDDYYSVDERAEKFIEKFYENIKLQRQQSLLEQFNALVDN